MSKNSTSPKKWGPQGTLTILVRCAVVGLILAALGTWAQVPGGIIELGNKGQKAKGSRTIIRAGGEEHKVTHSANDAVEDILDQFITHFQGLGYTAEVYNDPNDSSINAMRILMPDNSDPDPLNVTENDDNIHPTGVHYSPPNWLPVYLRLDQVDAVNGDGNVTFTITLAQAGTTSYVVSTIGKTAAQVNAEMKTALEGGGFDVSVSGGQNQLLAPDPDVGNQFILTINDDAFVGGRSDSTDTGVGVNGAGISSGSNNVPALSDLGFVVLTLILVTGGIIVLRRRRMAHLR